MPIRLKIAENSKDKELVYRVRHRVFVEEERRFSHPSDYVFDIYDSFDETVNVLGLDGDTPIASIRVTNENPVGLPAFEHYDFRPFIRTLKGKYGCVGWLCTLKRYRRYPGLIMGLFKMVVREMRKAGIRHMIATLHPPVMAMLESSFGAKAVGEEFFSGELKVPMLPIYVDIENFPPGSREFFRDPSDMIFEESKERRIYRKREVILKKGDTGNEAYLIMRGSVRVLPFSEIDKKLPPELTDRGPIAHGDLLLRQGQIFGELSLLDRGSRTASVIPHSREVDLMVWSQDELLAQLQYDRLKAFEICKLLGARLREQIEQVSGSPSKSLIARILIDASRDGNMAVDMGWLAQQCGVWLKDLEILVNSWTEKHWVACEDKNNIQVLNPKSLEKVFLEIC
jgi:CRP-like cAMP-binding protein